MLAYLFWHRPAEGVKDDAYERAQERLHRSLAARPPEGFRGSASYRAPELPWLSGGGAGYEDWYLVDDWAALGVLRQAAVSESHRTAHDEAARPSGPGAGAVYRLDEGEARPADVRHVIWVTPSHHGPELEIAALLLGDGMDRRHAGLWRRELNLGPAPEFCLLMGEDEDEDTPQGVGLGRVPAGWTVERQPREAVWVDVQLL
jgi:hypothetical protein